MSEIVDSRLRGQALVGRANGQFALEAVVTAPVGPTDVGVRTTWSGVSIGTEFAALSGKLDYGPFPITTGYMSIGVVEEVGAAVSGVQRGDRVYWRRNKELRSARGGEMITCATGAHASVAVVDQGKPGAGCGMVPEGVADDVASMFVLPAVGLVGVDMAQVNVGASVVVIGAGLVGLAVVAAAAVRGAVVTAVDVREQALRIAQRLGARHVVDAAAVSVDAEVRQVVGTAGADYVFEATGNPSLIDVGVGLCRSHGCFVWQGNYGKGQIPFEFLNAHGRRLRMLFPCGDGGRTFEEAVMESLARG